MTYLRRKLPAVLCAAVLAGSGAAVLAGAATPATAATGTLFDGFGRDLAENVALAGAESDARRNALSHGFTDCEVFESVVSQDARTHVFFALVTVSCEDAAR
ncbi:hypothetical protein ACIBQ6_29650 [Nonomuraea sp. NPDC049655]|uniref:hypothetical protein n=1 Tax=Nonomuraea sp. NPDC049655 TaxID=3364355 RepID=UPI003788F5D6